ncbi:hypothetical protein K3495_g9773 [Podosphaera aphanis]|nr:hypothetical protein K3495_g9773 [Podosphaera aphanis]
MNQIQNPNESKLASCSSVSKDSKPLNFVNKYKGEFAPHQFQASAYSGSIALNSASQLVTNSVEVTSPTVNVHQTSYSYVESCGSEQSINQPQLIFPYVSDEFVFYDQSDNSDSALIEKSVLGCKIDREVSLEADEVSTRQRQLNIPESLDSTKENSPEDKNCKNQGPGESTSTFSTIGYKNVLDPNPSTSFSSSQIDTVEGNVSDTKDPPKSRPKRNLHAFKKLTPVEVVEEYLRNSKEMSYEELYRRTANVALVMIELQNEARMIDKELHDFEVARKSDQQIAAEELRIEKEQQQKEDDAIFEMLLKKYGTFTRSSTEEWTEFHESFHKKNFEKRPDYCKIIPLLRNPQFISEFHKRTSAKLRAELKASTFKLANTVDSPPTKTEQKAAEESDRRKRKPAIDPVVFDDRKMADVYGLTYKVGEAFIGNQPLKDRNENSRDTITANGVDENSRPKRTRGKRGNCDSDQSDYTPVVSDADDNFRTKRIRTKKVSADKKASVYPISKTSSPSGSRESTPVSGPKVFASGKRVGRPPGSKTQVKLPSKLKSVQAAGEVLESDHPGDQPELHGTIQDNKRSQSEEDFVEISAEGDEISDKPALQKKHAVGRPRKKNLGIKELPEPSLKLKAKCGRPRKNATLKIADELKVVEERKSKSNVSQKDKALNVLRKDQDLLPSTEVEEENNGFPSFHSSRPTSSSPSTNISSTPGGSRTRSISKSGEIHAMQETPITRTRENRTAAMESTSQGIETLATTFAPDPRINMGHVHNIFNTAYFPPLNPYPPCPY